MQEKQSTAVAVPHDPLAEQRAVGAVLRDPTLLDSINLQPEEFSDGRLAIIYQRAKELRLKERPGDLGSITASLLASGSLAQAGGLDFVTHVEVDTPTTAYFQSDVVVIKSHAALRRIMDTVSNAANPGDDPQLTLANIVSDLQQISEDSRLCGIRKWIEFLSPTDLRRYQPPKDYVLVGNAHIQRGATFVIGGAPGVGKSRAAVALAVAGATGGSWLNLPVHHRFKTMICQNENGRLRLKDEFANLDNPLVDESIRISPPPSHGMAFDNPLFRAAVAAEVRKFNPDIFILDPWNSATADDKAKDYLSAFERVRDVLPRGDDGPALGIVAHTRKPRSDERAMGRSLLNLLAGSYVLVSIPRSVFVLQAAGDDPTDDRVVWTCCKNNDGEMGTRSAWYRRDNLFLPVEEFDWDEFDSTRESLSRRSITEEDIAALFRDGGGQSRMLLKKQAVAELMEKTGCSQALCYQALSEKGKFAGRLNWEGGYCQWKS